MSPSNQSQQYNERMKNMKNMKKLLALILCICVLFSFESVIFAAETNNAFTDVDANSDLGKDIYKLFNAGIINGNGDGTFTPYNPVTRAELCKMVNNIRGFSAVSSDGFTDVTADKWYYTHVLIGKQAGYINGFPDGSFRGDEYITREQVCAIICRAFEIYDLGIAVEINDEVSDWARGYVSTLVSNKLIKLEEGNTFRATQNMKRGELSTSLSNFVKDTPATQQPSVNVGGGSTGGGGSSGGTGSSGGSSLSNPSKPSGGSSGGNSSSGGSSSGGSSSNDGSSSEGSSSSGENTGATQPDSGETTPSEPAFDNSAVITNLGVILEELNTARVKSQFRETQNAIDFYDAMVYIITETQKITDKEITPELVRTSFSDKIQIAETAYDTMTNETGEKDRFKIAVLNLSPQSRSFLEEYFDINISDYM